jgi:hypothetical protein
MTEPRRRSRLAPFAGVLAAIFLVNVAIRLIGVPDVDIPSLDLPGWLKATKNAMFIVLVALAIIGAVQGERRRRKP